MARLGLKELANECSPSNLMKPVVTPHPRVFIRGLFAFSLLVWAAFACSLCCAGGVSASEPGSREWKAGTAVVDITPAEGLWMGGYASRTRPAEGKEMDLRLKVLALEDGQGHRGVIITCDVLGFPRSIYEPAIAGLKQHYGLEPRSIILSASHTHSGPVLRESAMDIYELDAGARAKIEKYSSELEGKLIGAVGKALADLAPARLAAGQGTTGFAVNRRNNREKEVPQLIAQGKTAGPVDHTVPVLAVCLPDGELKAVLFGYACHNTVMDYYKWSGDYAGFAQLAIERHHTNATAMFFMGCGADQNPLPRGRLALAERYGEMLAAAVEEALISPVRTVEPDLQTRMEVVDLALGTAPTEAELAKIAGDKDSPAMNRRWAGRLLSEMKAGKPFATAYPYPIQAWRFGGRQLLLTLGGEPVVDYALKFKREFGDQTWVAGYCNDVMGYIPSLRVLKEDATPSPKAGWGYEGARSMMAYGMPTWRWGESIEDRVTAAVRRLSANEVQTP